MNDVAPHDLAAEEAVLGACLLSDRVLPVLAVDEGLKPAHFYRGGYRDVYAAMLALADRDETVDAITLTAELERRGVELPAGKVDALAGGVPELGNVRAYARRVVELAQMRQLRLGAMTILEGVDRHDADRIAEGESLLRRETAAERHTSSPAELADDFGNHLSAGPGETFRWPYPRLDKLTMGGMRRGQLTLIAGWSSHGKSVFLDQTLESATRAGLRTHLFINEMTKTERVTRMVARLARVPFERISEGRSNQVEMGRILNALERLPFGITNCAGWSADDVAREIKRHRYDVVGIDIFNRFPFRGRDTREAKEEVSRVFNELAKTAECHVLLSAHLNRSRASGSLVLPFPSAADIRDTAMLYNDADNVLFVWRDQDPDTAEPLPDGIVRLAKVRNGRPGGVPVRFEGQFMSFETTLRQVRDGEAA